MSTAASRRASIAADMVQSFERINIEDSRGNKGSQQDMDTIRDIIKNDLYKSIFTRFLF